MKDNRIAGFNKLLLILIFLFFSISAISCSSGTEKQKTEGQIQSNTESASNSENLAVPKEKPDLICKVKDIVGNEVTVYKVEITEATEQNENSQNSTADETNQNNQDPRKANRTVNLKVTEETETFIIPVGTPIVTIQRGTNEVKTVALTDIKKDQFLDIWKKDDTVVFVQVIGSNRERLGDQKVPGSNGEVTKKKGGPGSPPLGPPLEGPR